MAKNIGIIGGMGPRATVEFEKLILDQFEGGDQTLPGIISYNAGAIPDRSRFLVEDGQDPVPAIQNAIDQLAKTDVDVLCMPCNTAHVPLIADRLDMRGIYFIHMPELVADKLRQAGMKRVAILATSGTVSSGMYQSMLSSSGIEAIEPPATIQQAVTQIIQDVKAGDINSARRAMPVVNSFLTSTASQAAVLACTELSFIANDVASGVRVVDTLSELAQAVASYTMVVKETVYDAR